MIRGYGAWSPQTSATRADTVTALPPGGIRP